MAATPGAKQRIFSCVATLLSVVLSFALLELGGRLVLLKSFVIPAGIEDPHYHHRLKPNTTYHFVTREFDVTARTNSYGLRGPDPVIPKPAKVIRILMLGDSYTFGFPVRDGEEFAALIERGLRERGYPVEVVNGGVSGTSPTLDYIALRDQFLSFQPDLVMLWYDLGDLQEDNWFQRNLIVDGHGRIERCDPLYINGHFDRWEWLKLHSVVASWADRKLVRTIDKIRVLGLQGYAGVIARGERAKVAIARVKAAQHASDLALNDRFLLVRPSSTIEMLAPYWELSQRYVLMIRDLLAQRQIPFVMGVYPYGMLVGPNQWGDGRTYWGFEKGKTYSADQALTLFAGFSRDHHVPLINTFDSFRAAGQHETLYYNWDGHFTPAGHRVLAEHVLHDRQFLSQLDEIVARQGLTRASSTTPAATLKSTPSFVPAAGLAPTRTAR